MAKKKNSKSKPLSGEQKIEALAKLGKAPKDTVITIPDEAIINVPTQRDRAIWTIMSLQSEINFQAADQKKTVVGKDPVKEKLSTLLYDMDPEGFIKENNERKSNVD